MVTQIHTEHGPMHGLQQHTQVHAGMGAHLG
jgi:hypothetical protein